MLNDGLRQLDAMTDDDLWNLLAMQISHGVTPEDASTRRKLALAWFTNHLAEFRDILCGNTSISNLLSNEEPVDLVTLTSGVADVLAPYFSTPTVFTLATLLSRYGLARLCRESRGDVNEGE